jgi:pimeloyl-ACP methyl ester carboxylesterase
VRSVISPACLRKPAIIGHSFGGLLTQILAGRGLAVASVAIDPAPFRGVLPLPISSLKSGFPVLGNPANRNPWTEAKVDTKTPTADRC